MMPDLLLISLAVGAAYRRYRDSGWSDGARRLYVAVNELYNYAQHLRV